MNNPAIEALKPCEEAFEQFLKDKSLSNEKDTDMWDRQVYKHAKIDAMWYAWQECWNRLTPAPAGTLETKNESLQKALEDAHTAAAKNNQNLCARIRELGGQTDHYEAPLAAVDVPADETELLQAAKAVLEFQSIGNLAKLNVAIAKAEFTPDQLLRQPELRTAPTAPIPGLEEAIENSHKILCGTALERMYLNTLIEAAKREVQRNGL